ncbi:MAG: hypothetical protein KDJ50_11080 [Alphaproteobacteria bacterium]|nr:hypothetical protein [Alphaproteobacteria bacterium]
MSKFFLILSAFALIVSVTVCASHVAHASVDTNTDVSISIDIDNQDDNSLGSNGCDMSCGGCCVHHATGTSHGTSDLLSVGKDQLFKLDTALFVSDFIYVLKRPPKV